MALFSKTTEPTREERIAAAGLKANSALSLFSAAAEELETAAEIQETEATSADEEANRLIELAERAYDQAEGNRYAAERIRSFFE